MPASTLQQVLPACAGPSRTGSLRESGSARPMACSPPNPSTMPFHPTSPRQESLALMLCTVQLLACTEGDEASAADGSIAQDAGTKANDPSPIEAQIRAAEAAWQMLEQQNGGTYSYELENCTWNAPAGSAHLTQVNRDAHRARRRRRGPSYRRCAAPRRRSGRRLSVRRTRRAPASRAARYARSAAATAVRLPEVKCRPRAADGALLHVQSTSTWTERSTHALHEELARAARGLSCLLRRCAVRSHCRTSTALHRRDGLQLCLAGDPDHG